MLKTFYTGCGGWTDRRLPDGTITWTAPSGHIYTTTPAGSLFFPVLATPTGDLKVGQSESSGSARLLMMPRRKRTRTQDRHYRITAERRINEERLAAEAVREAERIAACNDPPPF